MIDQRVCPINTHALPVTLSDSIEELAYLPKLTNANSIQNEN